MTGVTDVPTRDAADALETVHDVAVHAKCVARLGDSRVVRLQQQHDTIQNDIRITRTVGERRPPPRRIWIRGHIQSSDPDPVCAAGWVPKFNWDFIVQRYVWNKIFMKIRSVFQEIWAKLWKKCPTNRTVQESILKIPGSGCRGGWLPKFNQFFLVHGRNSGKILLKIRLVVFTWSR